MIRSLSAVLAAPVLLLGVVAGTALAQDSAGPQVCDALTVKGVALLRSTDSVGPLLGITGGNLTPDNIRSARLAAGCDAPEPAQTDAQVRQAVCAGLDINLFRQALPAELTDQQRRAVDAANALLPGVIDRTRAELGCSPSEGGVSDPAQPPVVAPAAPDVSQSPTDRPDDGGVADQLPVGGIDTGYAA